MSVTAHKLVIALVLCLAAPGLASAAVARHKYSAAGKYLVVEVLDDDLIHFEVSAIGSGPSLSQPLYTTPMVFKTDYSGPKTFVDNGNTIETAEIRLDIDPSNLCIAVKDKSKANTYLTTFCPVNLDQAFKGLDIDPGKTNQVYGLGQEFKVLGSSDGDRIQQGVRQGMEPFGNGFQGFQNAALGNVQIPVYYAVGSNHLNYAVFMDNVYRQRWDFTVNW
jgi:hypothetical protein